MATRTFVPILGLVFVALGVLGFIPGLVAEPVRQDVPLVVLRGEHGLLFGVLPVNSVTNLVYIAFGIWSFLSWRGAIGTPRLYSKSVAVIFAVLAVLGLIPLARAGFGLMPLYGGAIVLHALIAVLCAWFGFGNKSASGVRRMS